MKIIIIIIVGLIVLGIISAIIDFISDNIAIILGILVCGIIAGGSGFLYAKIGYSHVMLWGIGIVFLIVNAITFFVYLVKKFQYKKLYEWALDQARELNAEKGEIRKKLDSELCNIMNDCLMECGMGTDQEIWEEVKSKYQSIDELNEKINVFVHQLWSQGGYADDIREIQEAEEKIDLLGMYKEKIPLLVQNGDYIVNCTLNGKDKQAKSWDGNLYKSSRTSDDTLGKNMLPTEHLNID